MADPLLPHPCKLLNIDEGDTEAAPREIWDKVMPSETELDVAEDKIRSLLPWATAIWAADSRQV